MRRLLAVADGTLVAGSNPEVTLRVGEGTPYPAVLAGTLGAYGPSPLHPSRDTQCATAGDVTLTASVAGDSSPATAGRLSPTGQSVTTLLSQASGLDVRQEQFVPVSGAFLRTITWLQNPGAADVAVDVVVTADFGDGLGWALTGPSSERYYSLTTADTWAHAGHEASASEAGAAWGAGAASAHFQRGSNGDGVFRAGVTASFSVTVPAGQRLGLMAFAVGRAQNLGVPAQVRALADLSDPEALEGLSETDRQQIVNFTVPRYTEPAHRRRRNGDSRRRSFCRRASRGASTTSNGLVLAYGSTDASGHFVLRGLPAGDVRLVARRSRHEPARDHDRHRHRWAADDGGHRDPPRARDGHGPGHGLELLGRTGRGRSGDGDERRLRAALEGRRHDRPRGRIRLTAPPGTVHVRANDDPSIENIGALDPGGTLVLDLTVP